MDIPFATHGKVCAQPSSKPTKHPTQAEADLQHARSQARDRSRSGAKCTHIDPPTQQGKSQPSTLQQQAKPSYPTDRIPSNPGEAKAQGSLLLDLQGTGDCMYRALAAACTYMRDRQRIRREKTEQLRLSDSAVARSSASAICGPRPGTFEACNGPS